jgi:alpha-N-arabinofuranosidase
MDSKTLRRAVLVALCATAAAANTPILRVDAGRIQARVSPTLYGLMTEEINHSYDGGLYGELVSNRTFQDDPATPVHWSLVQAPASTASIDLDRNLRLGPALPVSLRFKLSAANDWAGVANDGFWGIPVRPHTLYYASFYADPGPGYTGPLTISLESSDGKTVWASAEVGPLAPQWRKYSATLETGDLVPSTQNRLVIRTRNPGTVWLTLVSLFPPTWHNRINGNRIDLMQLLADMHPAFLRFPGGNYLEGRTVDTRFNWKQTIGDLTERPGHQDDAWRYRSSDGMGLLEFLEWCEDLNMKPVLAVFAGLTLNRGTQPVSPGPDLQPYVQDALDEIEYVTGGPETTWGAERVKDGHPGAFDLDYVEVGNEDNFDRKPGSYDGRFAQFYDAIKDRYPAIQVIATSKVTSRKPDLLDEHFYRSAGQMESDAGHYDGYSRSGPKIFVGEWATREGAPTPNMNAALGDAAWMTGMERNSDLVVMASYAPLFVNVNPGAMQWKTDLIGYDALRSYGSPSYYAQAMFSSYHGDAVLPESGEAVPTQMWQPPAPRGGGPRPPPRPIPTLFYDATRDTETGRIYLKLVNTTAAPQPVRIEIAGADVRATGLSVQLSSAQPTDTNTIDEPTRIAPVVSTAMGLAPAFERTLPGYSITILRLDTR